MANEAKDAMAIVLFLSSLLLLVMILPSEASEPKHQGMQEITWKYLQTNTKDKSLTEIMAWQAAYAAAFDKIDCSIIPAKVDEVSDMDIIRIFGSRLLNHESCLTRVINILIRSRVSARTFGDFIFARKEWIPETYWGTILAALREHIPIAQFPEYYLKVIKCFDFVEAMAPHFRPALEKVKEEPAASVVRFTPLYFILSKVDVYVKRPKDTSVKALKEQDQYSAKLRTEFATILEVRPEEPVAGYLPTVEFYLDAAQYLKRATLNEQEYFNLNLWLRRTFLHSPKAEEFIIENDLYRLAYLLYLTGVDEDAVERMREKCAIGCFSLYLGRNRPVKLKVTGETCPAIKRLVRIYQRLKAPEKVIIPCQRTDKKAAPQQVMVPKLGSIEKTSKVEIRREAYLTFHMILRRLFEVSFDYLPMEQIEEQGKDLAVLMNLLIEDYCSAFNMNPAVVIKTIPTAQRSAQKGKKK